ncbi:MAG: GntR family transcriptional regulator [Saccharofermentanales bacterium]|jgi:GntR family transcriptional regulator
MVYPDINPQSGTPLYQQLKRSYRRMAALGVIEPHEQLPSVRQLATELGINPNTVQKAYRELEQEGLIYAVPGKGNFLAEDHDESSVAVDEIKRIFNEALHVAWVNGIRPQRLHALLDELIQAVKHTHDDRKRDQS